MHAAPKAESVDLFVVFDADAKEENEEHQINIEKNISKSRV